MLVQSWLQEGETPSHCDTQKVIFLGHLGSYREIGCLRGLATISNCFFKPGLRAQAQTHTIWTLALPRHGREANPVN